MPWIRRLPVFPWRLTLIATLVWLLLSRISLERLPAGLTPWIGTLDELLISYAFLLIVTWFALDLPTSLGLWRQPPKILRDLSLLLIATAITVVIVQQQVRINLISLVTASAVLTAVIGLAAQETLKDLFAGITLQLDPPFRLGDWIELGETRGVVCGFTLMNTELSTLDGSRVLLPNSFVAEEQLRRFRAEDPLGVHFSVGLDYSYPPARARALLLRVLRNNKIVLSDPEPKVWIDHYADSAIVYEVLAYQRGSASFAIRDLRSALLLDIWYALRREGQTIPFPVRQIESRRVLSSREPFGEHGSANAELAEKRAALARNPLLSVLDDEQLTELAVRTRIQHYAPGEAVVVEGDDDDDLYQVLNGQLEVSRYQGLTNSDQIISSLTIDQIFGEMSLFLDAPRSATVRAVNEVSLLQLSRSDLAPLLAADPRLFERFAVIVGKRRLELDAISVQHEQDSDGDILSRMKSLFASLLPIHNSRA